MCLLYDEDVFRLVIMLVLLHCCDCFDEFDLSALRDVLSWSLTSFVDLGTKDAYYALDGDDEFVLGFVTWVGFRGNVAEFGVVYVTSGDGDVFDRLVFGVFYDDRVFRAVGCQWCGHVFAGLG